MAQQSRGSGATTLLPSVLLLLFSGLCAGSEWQPWSPDTFSGVIYRSRPIAAATSYSRQLAYRLQLLREQQQQELELEQRREVVVSTTPRPAAAVKSRLVTLPPLGNSIQDILYNNGYRAQPAPRRPPPDNIDHSNSLDGVDPEEVWLLRDGLMVLRGGAFGEQFIDSEPIDDYQAPYRRPKFPPPGYQPDSEQFSGAPLSRVRAEAPPLQFNPAEIPWPRLAARSLQARRLATGSPRRGPVTTPQWSPVKHYRERPTVTPIEPSRPDNFLTYHSPHAGYTITYTSRQR